MLEIIIGKALIALLIGAAITTIWRHVEELLHQWIKNSRRLRNHPQVRKVLHGVVRFMFIVARWSRKVPALPDHIGVLYHAADGNETAVCVFAEDIHKSEVPQEVMSAIDQRGRYVYRQDT